MTRFSSYPQATQSSIQSAESSERTVPCYDSSCTVSNKVVEGLELGDRLIPHIELSTKRVSPCDSRFPLVIGFGYDRRLPTNFYFDRCGHHSTSSHVSASAGNSRHSSK